MMEINRDVFNSLRASRKHDRALIADHLTEIAFKHGATVERHYNSGTIGYCGQDTVPSRRPEPRTVGYRGQGIDLRIACKGVGAMIDVDDLHGGEWALIAWFNTEHPARNFSSAFRVAVRDGGNGRPHHKATSHPRDWYSLAMMLDGGLMLGNRGEAFDIPSAT